MYMYIYIYWYITCHTIHIIGRPSERLEEYGWSPHRVVC